MKKTLKLLSVLFFVGITQITFAQKKEWKEMHAFHTVMSKIFHPAEEGNIEPLKANATLLLTKAQEWKKSAVPKGYDRTTTAPILDELVKECSAIQEAVKNNKSDEELKTLITQAHETFHQIMEKCRK